MVNDIPGYINIPGQENGNWLTWIDAANTQIYAINVTNSKSTNTALHVDDQKYLNKALDIIREYDSIYSILGESFLVKVSKRNQF